MALTCYFTSYFTNYFAVCPPGGGGQRRRKGALWEPRVELAILEARAAREELEKLRAQEKVLRQQLKTSKKQTIPLTQEQRQRIRATLYRLSKLRQDKNDELVRLTQDIELRPPTPDASTAHPVVVKIDLEKQIAAAEALRKAQEAAVAARQKAEAEKEAKIEAAAAAAQAKARADALRALRLAEEAERIRKADEEAAAALILWLGSFSD